MLISLLTMRCTSRVVYEGSTLECVLDGCTTEEDIEHRFRVAAINGVGRGPFSTPVTFTQKKACEFRDTAGSICLSSLHMESFAMMIV